MRAGDKVKIPDIGPLATVIQPGRHIVNWSWKASGSGWR